MRRTMQLQQIDDRCETLPVNGRHGLCRAYYQPDELDVKAVEYANELIQQHKENLYALDLGCSPYFPQSQRFAKLGFEIDAFDLEKPFMQFNDINQQLKNRIHYHVKNLKDIATKDLRKHYQIVYSNRCLSFLSFQDAYRLIHTLVDHLQPGTRYFLAFFGVDGQYAENYPVHLPLSQRFVPLDNPFARQNQMLAPACLYTQDEIFNELLKGSPISLIEMIHTNSGSLKIIFEKLSS